MAIYSKTPVKYVHLTRESLDIVEAIDEKTFSEKLEVIIRGYEVKKELCRQELRLLEGQIAQRQADLRAIREALEAAQVILRKHLVW